jgi:hypothetical protein
MRRRSIGGVWFRCLSPGSWLSADGRLAIVHMLAGTPQAQWELYWTQHALSETEIPEDPDDTDFLCGDFLCGSIDFGGHALAEDVRKRGAQ